jgi:hypothetical protein
MSYIPPSDSLNVLNASGVTINPATDESVLLLRRMVKILDSLATVDQQSRQKVNVDAINSGISIGVVQITPGLLQMTPNQATAASLNMTAFQPTASLLNANVGTVTNIAGYGGVDPRFQFIDTARIAYATNIRANLNFS